MVDINQFFSSGKYLKSADITQPTLFEIAGTRVHSFKNDDGSEDSKLICSFVGSEKEMVLNKTNSSMIAYAYGSDTDGWLGAKVILCVKPVEFKGSVVDGLRIELPQDAPRRSTDAARQAIQPQQQQMQSGGSVAQD